MPTARYRAATADSASIGDQAVVDYLATLDAVTVRGRVRELLVEALEAGEPDVDVIAAELAMSGRTLQRRLRVEGTSLTWCWQRRCR